MAFSKQFGTFLLQSRILGFLDDLNETIRNLWCHLRLPCSSAVWPLGSRTRRVEAGFIREGSGRATRTEKCECEQERSRPPTRAKLGMTQERAPRTIRFSADTASCNQSVTAHQRSGSAPKPNRGQGATLYSKHQRQSGTEI